MMGWSPRYYIPSFVEIGPPVLEKKIFEAVFTIYSLTCLKRPLKGRMKNGLLIEIWFSKSSNTIFFGQVHFTF